MKKLAFILFISFFQFNIFAQQAIKPKTEGLKPIMKFETEELDYGKIKQNSDGVRYFKFKNVGSAPLIIEDVKGSCGCTIPTKPTEPIMPGKTGEIKVKYATNRVGKFIKTVSIVSNATDTPKVVKIKGEVLEN